MALLLNCKTYPSDAETNVKVINMAEMKATAPPLANIEEASFEISTEHEPEISEVHDMPEVSDLPELSELQNELNEVEADLNEEQAKFDENDHVPSEPIEEQFESKKIQKPEHAISLYKKIDYVQQTPIININDFPSIDNSEQNDNIELSAIVSQSKNNLLHSYPNANISDLKRDKTYDGCPIYRVNKFCSYSFVFISLFDLIDIHFAMLCNSIHSYRLLLSMPSYENIYVL